MGRFKTFSGPPSGTVSDVAPYFKASAGNPQAGGPVDVFQRDDGQLRQRFLDLIHVDTGGSFSSGDDIATDSLGRAVQAGTGDVVVARALENSTGAGSKAWCTWAHGR